MPDGSHYGGATLGILDEIKLRRTWEDFLSDRVEKDRVNKSEAAFFSSLINTSAYLDAADAVKRLSTPQKRLINKSGSTKKRAVYSYTPEENAVLKVIAFLCYRFDGSFSDNLYSFRRERFAKTAVRRMTSHPGIDAMYGYKLDIKNYFNSIDPDILLQRLKDFISSDPELYGFFCGMLSTGEAEFDGELIRENRGVMAGTATSTFLANVFLAGLDSEMWKRGVLYARYSDDIIVFAKTKEELDVLKALIRDALHESGLEVNHEKELSFEPHERWSFLGIAYCSGEIDICDNTVDKMKAKIRRKARALYRWKVKKGASDERALTAFFRSMNKKLYCAENGHEFSWSRWFFPLINTDKGLKTIDQYMLSYARYVVCGGFSRKNYRVRYKTIKSMGYRSLVAEYYSFKKAYEAKRHTAGKAMDGVTADGTPSLIE